MYKNNEEKYWEKGEVNMDVEKFSHGADSTGVTPFGMPNRIFEGNPSAAMND